MGRKHKEKNPECSKRLLAWLEEVDAKPSHVAAEINYSQQLVSYVLSGERNMTIEFANAVSQRIRKPIFEDGVIVGYDRIRPEYLLGIDNEIRTVSDFDRQYVLRNDAVNDACHVMLNSSLREVCAREGIPVPTLDNIPEVLLLEAQLRDYADSLIWNYVKWKDCSHVWSMLEQAEEARKRSDMDG